MRIHLGQLIENVPVAIYVCEAPTGIIRFFNRKAVELWGREPALGDTDARFCGSLRLHRLDGSPLPHSETPMGEVLRNGIPRTDEVVIERPDGSRIVVSVDIAPLRSPKGRVIGAVNVFQDVTRRKSAERALLLSESRYRAVVEDQPEMVSRFLPDGTLTFVNEAYCRYFGLSREQAVGQRYLPFIHPEDLPHVQELLSTLSPQKRVVVIENRVTLGDGASRWTQWTNTGIFDEEGRIQEFQSTGRDTTDQKRAEEDAARLAAVVEGAEDAIISKTPQGIVTSWNRAAELMFGFSADEVLGRRIHAIIPSERMEEEAEILRRIQQGVPTDHFETERVRKDGTRVPVSLTVSPVRDPSGRIIGASSIARDVSERRRAEQELQASLRTLELLYHLVDRIGRARSRAEVTEAAVEAVLAAAKADRASVLLFDEEGKMRFASFRGLSKRYQQAVDGHSPWSPDQPDPAPILVEDVEVHPEMAALRPVISREGIRSLAFVPLFSQGRLTGKFMIYYDEPHSYSEDEVRLATTIAKHVGIGLSRVDSEAAIEDLLQRERAARREADAARADAERANRAKDEFLAMLSHELRNPLSAIVNAVEVIAAKGPPEPGTAVRMIRRQSQHLARLLDDLLDVARITSGRIEIEHEPVDLVSAVRMAVDAQRHRIETKRQRLSLSLPGEQVPVEADPVRIQQVLGNLLNNACKYTPTGGAIDVSLGVDGENALFRVRDDGAGIRAENLESIFELFAQANPSLARTEGGLGIGLTLVRRVVELHGGDVWATSEGPGRGAEFTVRLPIRRAATMVETEARERLAGASLRILVIEDHQDGREALEAILKQFGHQVSGASNGREGIEKALSEKPDIVLVDIGLPDVDGYQVARELRQSLGDRVRLLALTGYGQPGDRFRAGEAGFDLHLVKPFDPAKLQEIMDRLARPPAIA
jgi:PAS domain S-box-containing protein